ncbi:MAG: efflux RND transporter periplasmic adaptor subunit [Bacteroidetes bacterium]|nr:MAG: efflux RND transporter periplasmic adaptor subunit [Bacteroidota bacterium]
MKASTKIQTTILTLSLLIFAACQTAVEQEEQDSKVLVRVKPSSMHTVVNNLEFTGTVLPYEEAHIAPAVPARINRILVDVGDKVSKGQLLVEMDNTQLFQAQVQLDNLKTELARLDTLLKAGAVTQQAYDQLRTQYQVAQSNIDNLSTHTQVRSTLDGVVTGRYFSAGEMFTGTPSPAGKPAIVSINQIKPVKVIVGVSERFLPQVTKGQPAGVTSDVYPDQVFNGKVNRIFPTIDRATGTFRVEIVIDNRDESLRPGMFARVALSLGEHEALLVPAMSVLKQTGSNERFVFVIENNTAQRLTVEPGRKFDDRVEILTGLNPGQQLVITGQHNLIQGSEVEIVK